MTGLDVDGPQPAARGGRRLVGATAGMAVGTALSRVTGLARVIALTAALGGNGFADAYNLANTTPNIVTDIVIGGVLSATFVPVFVDHLATRRGKDAWEAISAVVTVTVAILVVATAVFFVLTPEIVRLYTVHNHGADVAAQQRVATYLLRWFVPQLTCYGLIALFTALLNSRSKYAMPMFVPVANNLVVIVVLLWFHALVPHPTLASIDAHHRGLTLLAIGTTLGVVVQAVLLIPSLLRADLHLTFRWQPRHEAVHRIIRLAGWTFGWVVANQVALFVVLALADPINGAVSAYTYAYQFFLLPYGIVAVSIMTAVAPSLAARWARRDTQAFRRRMDFGLRGILAIVIPSAVGMVALAHPLIELVLRHGAETTSAAQGTGAALAMFGLGLPGFCTFQYMVRVLQSMQDTKTAFRLYLVSTTVTVVLAVVLVGPLGVRGLALSLSVAYTVAAGLGLAVVHRRIGGLSLEDLGAPLRRIVGASAVMGVAVVLAVNVSGSTSNGGLLLRIAFAVVVGVVTYVGTVFLLGSREDQRRGLDPDTEVDVDAIEREPLTATPGRKPVGFRVLDPADIPPPTEPAADDPSRDEHGTNGDDRASARPEGARTPSAPSDAPPSGTLPSRPPSSPSSAPPTPGADPRGKLDARSGAFPHRHLRAVRNTPDWAEEDPDGPHPGGDR